MVVLEAIGLASKEVFDYNRENFSFDNEQRIDKEKTRLAMQVERFSLFREDIEDLVKLTVSKMDMYHAVAALLLGSAATLYTEGRMHTAGNTPPWYIGIYFISIAGTFCYLILAVWLSMYASVASHSFGVRLRTRYVRLPIPSLAQLQSVTAKLQDFEKQGAGSVMRIPFGPSGAPQWQLQQGGGAAEADWQQDAPRQQTVQFGGASSSSAGTAPGSDTRQNPLSDWLDKGEAAFGKHDIVEQAAVGPGQHVQLFRRLQAKWQCYDAYARVSMSIGINNLMQTMNYYLLGACLIENCSVSTAVCLTLIFQAGSTALNYLDVVGMTLYVKLIIQGLGVAPAIIVLIALATAAREESSGLLVQHNKYWMTPLAFLINVAWYEALLWVARPSNDEATLPRKFRSVLFLDVFGDAHYDPTEAEQVIPNSAGDGERRSTTQMEAAHAERDLSKALAGLRRWEAVPQNLMSEAQLRLVNKCRQDFEVWRKAYHGFIIQHMGEYGVIHHDHHWMEEHGARAWSELTYDEMSAEPFADTLLGPFDREGRPCFFDLEAGQRIYEELPGREVLSTRVLQKLIKTTELAVTAALAKTSELGGDGDNGGESAADGAAAPAQRPPSGTPPRVERLPWKTVHTMTRCFQLCWIFLGIMDLLWHEGFNFDAMKWADDGKFDTLSKEVEVVVPEEKQAASSAPVTESPNHERRLSHVVGDYVEQAWQPHFSRLKVTWPHGSFFRPQAILSVNSSLPDVGSLIVTSPFLSYRADSITSSPVRLDAMPRDLFPAGSAIMCGASAEPRCIVGKLTPTGLALWPFGENPKSSEAVLLSVRGPAWRQLAGALVRCGQAADLLAHRQLDTTWCLVLAGWDGQRVPVAAVPLPTRSPATLQPMPLGVEAVVPLFDIPVSAGSAKAASSGGAQFGGGSTVRSTSSPVSLHVSAGSCRLWTLSAGGEMQAWDLLHARRLGRWWLRWPLQVATVCERHDTLFVAGLDSEGPALGAARLPVDLDAAAESVMPGSAVLPPLAV